MTRNFFLCAFFILISICIHAQNNSPVLYHNAVVHIGNGRAIQNGAILIQGEKILKVGESEVLLSEKSNSKSIDLEGKHIYPGFICMGTTVGLRDVDAVRASLDYAEVGNLNPNVRSAVAYNTDSDIIPTISTNGVLIVQSMPLSGMISGTSSVMKLSAWNWEDAVIKEDGIHITYPQSTKFPWWMDDKAKAKRKERITENKNILEKFLSDAKAYSEFDKELGTKNQKLEAFQGLFTGETIAYLHADYAMEIIDGIELLKKNAISKIVLIGGDDALEVADYLVANKIPVVLRKLHALPEEGYDPVDSKYSFAAQLFDKEVSLALSYDNQAMGIRNLPFIAGTARAYGLPEEEAIKAISLNPAKFMGIDSNYGSLEAGKSATFFISDGDALEMISHKITEAFIDGQKINLDNFQTKLAEKYLDKYDLK